jgi:hypothetical protein
MGSREEESHGGREEESVEDSTDEDSTDDSEDSSDEDELPTATATPSRPTRSAARLPAKRKRSRSRSQSPDRDPDALVCMYCSESNQLFYLSIFAHLLYILQLAESMSTSTGNRQHGTSESIDTGVQQHDSLTNIDYWLEVGPTTFELDPLIVPPRTCEPRPWKGSIDLRLPSFPPVTCMYCSICSSWINIAYLPAPN